MFHKFRPAKALPTGFVITVWCPVNGPSANRKKHGQWNPGGTGAGTDSKIRVEILCTFFLLMPTTYSSPRAV